MANAVSHQKGDDARLWAAAICISLLINGLLLTWISYEMITSEIDRKKQIPATAQAEQVVKIFPDMIERPESAPEKKNTPVEPEVVRTSEDQESAEPPSSRRFIGERNTRATSDRAATSDDKAMPSQAGREARDEKELETTESDYQDGKLDNPSRSPSTAAPPPAPLTPPSPADSMPEAAKGEKSKDEGEAEKAQTAIREKLLDGPNPIETPVPKAEERTDVKPREEKQARDGKLDGVALKKENDKPKETPKPRTPSIDDPAFSGYQRKTAILGSISRTGRSALDVEDTPMGRYQSLISRAVEQEWQRNCVRHRDFITPGYLTVRFFVETSGRVKTVQFVGEAQTGQVQKGFTLNSIRDADIPAMPAEVKREMDGHALELIFNFYF
ncbi:hypothetical protein ACFSSA_00240 [Luteolibacter algae]|uniref:TonB C-terminal domain-containing protein n=1 Tax=Luteolibacter algae TaxID=454151 RepID=A0ABW5D3J4_9BACT